MKTLNVILQLTPDGAEPATAQSVFKQILRLDADSIIVVGKSTPAVDQRVETFRSLGIKVDTRDEMTSEQMDAVPNAIRVLCHA